MSGVRKFEWTEVITSAWRGCGSSLSGVASNSAPGDEPPSHTDKHRWMHGELIELSELERRQKQTAGQQL